MGRLLILGLVAGLVPAAVQAQPAAPERLVPRESESNAVTGIVPDRVIGDAALSPPRIWGNAMLVRTILSINEENQSMVFAGNVPVGSKVQFMIANFDRVIDSASIAASTSLAARRATL